MELEEKSAGGYGEVLVASALVPTVRARRRRSFMHRALKPRELVGASLRIIVREEALHAHRIGRDGGDRPVRGDRGRELLTCARHQLNTALRAAALRRARSRESLLWQAEQRMRAPGVRFSPFDR